ncbi:GSCOCG00013328001-RA-CDS [Cotesia congregata]|nr:GSCOCG00013328001-RA-CDS [Cotesia congregata]
MQFLLLLPCAHCKSQSKRNTIFSFFFFFVSHLCSSSLSI